jgi:hypothetical protein
MQGVGTDLGTADSESGAGDTTMRDIAAHVSKQMLKHHSHIRMEAKRRALETIVARKANAKPAEQAAHSENAAVVVRTVLLLLAVPCLFFGGLVLLSRFLAWTSGAALYGYLCANRQPQKLRSAMKSRMVLMEVLFWSLGFLNIWVFAARFL